MKKMKMFAKWGGLLLVSFALLVGGYAKCSGSPDVSATFQSYGYPDWFQLVVGLGEMVGALCLFIPRIARLAALVLSMILAGAIGTHLIYQEWLNMLAPIVLMVILGFVFLPSRKPVKELP